MKKKFKPYLKRFKAYIIGFIKILKRPEMAILPGQLAFFFVLSVVPIATLISYFASFFNISINFISNFIAKAFSSEIAELITPMVSVNTISVRFFISLFVGFFIASNGADSIIVTSNAIEGIPNTSYAKRRIKAIIMTMIIVILFVFILLVPVFGNKIIELFKFVDLNSQITLRVEQIFILLKGPVSWFIMFMFIKIIYTMAPDKRTSSSYTNVGAAFTTILWIIITSIYSFYITHFARYDVFYGGLANLVILMLWVYLLAYIFVIGMCLNFHYKNKQLPKDGYIKTK